MTLAAENIALKAENARLREALANIKKLMSNWLERYHRTGEYPKDYLSAPCNIVLNALTQPAPATPVTDKAQEVIDAACAVVDNPMFAGMCDQDCTLMEAVEAYRGGA